MSKKSNFHPCLLTGYINVFVVMWQDAKEIITRRMRAIAGAFLFIINVFVVMWQDAKEIITRRMRAIAGGRLEVFKTSHALSSNFIFQTLDFMDRHYLVRFRTSELLYRTSEVLYRTSEVLYRTSEVLFRTSKVLC